MLHTDDLIRDTEKNIAKGYSDDFTDLFKYAFEKGKAEAIEEILDKIDEGVCHNCEHRDVDCIDNCNANNWEYEAFKKWLKEQKNG